MSASKSKFILKPSSLSQHTVNFNKILEEIPVPKTSKIEELNEQPHFHKADEKEQINPVSAVEFVFGEKLCDRVVNVSKSDQENDDKNEEDGENNTHETKEDTQKYDRTVTRPEQPTEYTEHEIDNYSEILKLNCKLFCLESDKVTWNERGFGILKIIENSDKNNLQLMMWTHKCFRLILNTIIFETMFVDRATLKSIRINALDNGSIKIFLIKTQNSNDCDELYTLLKNRVDELKQTSKNLQRIEKEEIMLTADCEVKIGGQEKELVKSSLKISKRLNGSFIILIRPLDENLKQFAISSNFEDINFFDNIDVLEIKSDENLFEVHAEKDVMVKIKNISSISENGYDEIEESSKIKRSQSTDDKFTDDDIRTKKIKI